MVTCKICGEPLEFVREIPQGNMFAQFFGAEIKMPRMCACMRKAEAARQRTAELKAAMIRKEETLRESLMFASYRDMKFANDDGKDATNMRTARAYADNAEEMFKRNDGLMLMGQSGTGKTFIAGCIANELLSNGFSVMMTNAPTLVASMTKNFGDNRDEILDKVRSKQFLILDDLGFGRNTSYMNELLFEIINARYESQRPLIVTTNLTAEQFKTDDVRTARIFSRIQEMCPLVLNVQIVRRRDKSHDKLADMKAVLGL